MKATDQFIFDSFSNEKNLVITQCSLSEEPEVVVAIMGGGVVNLRCTAAPKKNTAL